MSTLPNGGPDSATDGDNLNNSPPELDLDNPPFPLTAIDRQILATPDSAFHRTTWTELIKIIGDNRLELLKRTPNDLRRYLAWSHAIKSQYGSITNFVLQERLGWTPLNSEGIGTAGSLPPQHQQRQPQRQQQREESHSSHLPHTAATAAAATTADQHPPDPSITIPQPPTFETKGSTPLQSPLDYAIPLNDWPYGLEPGIVHLIVWSKLAFPITDAKVDGRGDVTAGAREGIEGFVQRVFVRGLEEWEGGKGKGNGEGRVLWFKNWVGLMSVRGVDHVHVLVREPDEGLVEKWTKRRDLEEEDE